MNLLQISRSTLKRYREKGILKARRLPSGQYTFDDDSVFLLKNGRSPRLTLLYGRVSTYKQKHDLANQMQELQDFAEKKGYQVCEDIINVSKTRRKRVLPAMQSKLISAVEFNTVLTKSQAMMHISMVQRLLKLMLPKLLKQMAHHKMVKTSQ